MKIKAIYTRKRNEFFPPHILTVCKEDEADEVVKKYSALDPEIRDVEEFIDRNAPLVEQIRALFNAFCNFYEVYEEGDKIAVFVDGDWKHDHKHCDHILDLCFDLEFEEENVQVTNNSDFYSATRIYRKKEPKLKGEEKERELYFTLGNDIIADDEDIYCCIIGWDQGNTHNGIDQFWLISKEKPNKRMLSAFWEDLSERARIISVRKFKSIGWFAGGINHLYGSVIHWENDPEEMKRRVKDNTYLRYNISEIVYPDHPDYPRKVA